MGGGGTDHKQNALSFRRGTSQHADYAAYQGEVNHSAQKLC